MNAPRPRLVPAWILVAAVAVLAVSCAEQPKVVKAPVAEPDSIACDFPLFQTAGASACEPIAYTPQACARYQWFGSQALLETNKVCLGLPEPPSGRSCTESPDNLRCYLERHPRACNYLDLEGRTPCLDELFMTCIEHGDLGNGMPTWVTRIPTVAKQPAPPPLVASQMCHWQKSRGAWPVVAE
jgi:hypothetical protein